MTNERWNRRAFLKSAAAASGLLLSTGISAAPLLRRPWVDQMGVQLYTLRDRMSEDFEGTVERVAEIGYDEVEFAGYYDRSPQDVRRLLERVGLTAPSTHLGLDELREDLEGTLDRAATVGHRYVTVPSLPGAFGGNFGEDDWRGFADEFNRIGTAAKERGLRFAYHNHSFEFGPVDDETTGYDLLVAETDPELVTFELDLFWAVLAGHDPVALIEKYPGRFELWHVKDLKNIAATRSAEGRDAFRLSMQNMTSVGGGEIDFERIFAQAERSGLRHYFVENDRPEDSFANVEESYAYLTRLLG